jgi:FkbM family methyltransferase
MSKNIDGWELPDRDRHWQRGQITDYQDAIFEAAMPWVKRPHIAIDVGAHIGIFSVRMARAGFGVVAALEPDVDNYECLVRNTAANGGRIRPIFGAANVAPGRCRVVRDADDNSGANHIAMSVDGVIPVFKLDELVPSVGLIKIDVEGGELGVLLGAQHLIRLWSPVIIVENANIPIRELLDSHGYEEAASASRDSAFVRTKQ